MYVRLLADIPVEELQVVVDQAVAECKFMPTIAELRDRWHSLTAEQPLTGGDAWLLVMKQVRSVGSWGKPEFDNPLVARATESIGWRDLCMSDNIDVVRAHFLKVYAALAERHSGEQKLLPQARQLTEHRKPLGMTHIKGLLK